MEPADEIGDDADGLPATVLHGLIEIEAEGAQFWGLGGRIGFVSYRLGVAPRPNGHCSTSLDAGLLLAFHVRAFAVTGERMAVFDNGAHREAVRILIRAVPEGALA